MDRKLALILVASTAFAILTITAVTATPWASGTPLYAYRMEQASNKMNFLPTQMTTFTYIAEKGYTVHYGVISGGQSDPLHITAGPTACEDCETVTWPYTCEWSCWFSTCPANTCSNTCYTCPEDTCNSTCTSPWTCHKSTCAYTCNDTCTSPWTCQHSGCS